MLGFSQKTHAESKVVIIPKETFVQILSSIEFLSESREELIQETAQLSEQVALLREKDKNFKSIIDSFSELDVIYNDKDELFSEEVNKLNNDLDRQKVISDIKDYLLIGLIGVVSTLIIVGL